MVSWMNVTGLESINGSFGVVNDAYFFPRLIDYGENQLKLSQLCLKPHPSHSSLNYLLYML